jgi:hypothetical protein
MLFNTQGGHFDERAGIFFNEGDVIKNKSFYFYSKINFKSSQIYPSIQMATAASVAALRNLKSYRLKAGVSHLSLQSNSERKIEGEHDLEMLMLDG